MRKYHQTDTNLIQQAKKHIEKHGIDRYTYKEIEGLEIIHEND